MNIRGYNVIYLLDASVLIDASNSFYEMDRVSPYWEWLLECANQDLIKIPYEILLEIEDGSRQDDLSRWTKQNRSSLLLNEDVDILHLRRIQKRGYAHDLTESEVRKIGNDPFLIAYAYAHRSNRTIVTAEVSRPSKQRANRKIPDVCNDLSICCINTFQLNAKLDFRI